MSRSILLQKVDPKAENGTGSFPPADIRSALKAIGGPFFKEWSVDGGGRVWRYRDGRADTLYFS
ncbi:MULTISPECIES: hypothetical protein [unclassified Asaia]|uniref:hypothetical protein n=1 Tax=unclassified Asaia TaxID=2685023 RepID=UPI000F8E393C|nr:hypothetical protein [Asaia sp. W19]